MSPAYSASTASLPITAIYPGDKQQVWNAEQPAPPSASQAVALAQGFTPFGGGSYQISVEILFSGAPGVFEVDVEEADTDVDAAYQMSNANNKITAVNPGNYGRIDLTVKARFVRLKLVSRTNAVNISGSISR